MRGSTNRTTTSSKLRDVSTQRSVHGEGTGNKDKGVATMRRVNCCLALKGDAAGGSGANLTRSGDDAATETRPYTSRSQRQVGRGCRPTLSRLHRPTSTPVYFSSRPIPIPLAPFNLISPAARIPTWCYTGTPDASPPLGPGSRPAGSKRAGAEDGCSHARPSCWLQSG